ncbi:MAG: hypothetical protein RIQ71_1853 [Verrucomicrobiota bacterium]
MKTTARLLLSRLVPLLCLATWLAAPTARAIEITSATLPAEQTLQILTGFVSYGPITVRGNDVETTKAITYPYVIYVTGNDIYSNPVYIPLTHGTVTVRGQYTIPGIPPAGDTVIVATTATIPAGRWNVPNDGTLHNLAPGYKIVVAFYNIPGASPTDPYKFPSSLAELTNSFLSSNSDPLKIDVLPDLKVGTPGVTYPAAGLVYQGGDIIEFVSTWANDTIGDESGGARRQSRPLRSLTADRYIADLRITSNPVFGDTNNDDFLISRLLFTADVPAIVDGGTLLRKLQVIGTPTDVPPYGIPDYNNTGTPIAETVRGYVPQPDDGFLDIGESVTATTEGTIPSNFSGSYFAALKVTMSDEAEDASTNNNTFVSNAANKIDIDEAPAPTTEPASVVSTDTGVFVQGGNAASDFSSVSEDGGLIAFASRATNLLNSASGDTGLTTSGQQIFIKYRESGEIVLASINLSGQQANQDCFDPSISADARYVAYASRAGNLTSTATGARSAIYVYDTATFTTTVVSKNSLGQAANGDSFRPRMSQSGRYVVFDSVARNLDAARPIPTANKNQQIYLHDRDVDGNGVFDEPGNIATYLVSLTGTLDGSGNPIIANGYCVRPVVNLEDTAQQMTDNGGMYVAYTSYARNMPSGTGDALVYRIAIAPNPSNGVVGPRPESVVLVSQNENGQVASSFGVDPVNAYITPLADEAAINGDGSQVAYMSAATNLKRNEEDGTYTPTYPNDPYDATSPVIPGVIPAGDYNRVPDIFVRNFKKPLFFPGNGAVVRVSEAQPRVATGTITFLGGIYEADPWPGTPADNIPDNQPAPDDKIAINDGTQSLTFVFDPTAVVPGEISVTIGATIQETRDNLVTAINSSPLLVEVEATNPPNVNPPGTGYFPSVYLRNLVRGSDGNVPIDVLPAGGGANGVILATGMAGGGTQADDDSLAPGDTSVAPIQGVPFGSGQPSIDRSGRFVAFRTIATNLDVYEELDHTAHPTSPAKGELIRPRTFPASNVYLHDRNATDLVDGGGLPMFDSVISTVRVSLNKFGYKTLIDGTEQSGLNAGTSANSSRPTISADARFVSFSSDASGEGGLIFGPNNLTPLDNVQIKDVFVFDRKTVGDNPVAPATKPTVEISSPVNGLSVSPGTVINVSAVASPTSGKNIASVQLLVNGVSQGLVTAVPFTWTFTAPTAGTYLFNVIATDNKGVTGNAVAQVNVVQPIVPANPPAGSNQAFVVDYFNKIFLRAPTYQEYDYYLGLLGAGQTQAAVIIDMMNSIPFGSANNVLFGYYLRMGVTPTSTNEVSSFVSLMTSPSTIGTNVSGTGTNLTTNIVTGTTPLPATMSAGVALTNATSPYGATYGQASVAQQLINRVTTPWTNGQVVASMANVDFLNWAWRSFNTPYLSQGTTSPVVTMGSQASLVANMTNFVPQSQRFGANYAFLSGFYQFARSADTGLNNALNAFDPLVKGIAVNYLLTPSNTWATNVGPLTTNLVQSLLPPAFNSVGGTAVPGTNNITVGTALTNQILGQNFRSNTAFLATNLPPGLSLTSSNGTARISGTPTSTGTGTNKLYTVVLQASNGPGLVGTNRFTYRVQPLPPVITSATNASGTQAVPFNYFITATNFPTSFGASNLPPGILFNFATGQIVGTPTTNGIFAVPILAINSGGTNLRTLTLSIAAPAALRTPVRAWMDSYGLTNGGPTDTPLDGSSDSYIKQYAFGMDPTKPDTVPWTVYVTANTVTVLWTERLDGTVSYRILKSNLPTSGGSWSVVDPVSIIGSTVTRGIPANGPTPTPAGYDWIRVELPRATLGTKQFFKVEAVINSSALGTP